MHIIIIIIFQLTIPTILTTPPHTHSTESGRVECLYILPRAIVTGQGIQYGALSANGDSVDILQGRRGGEVTQGQSGSPW